jgi:hypothetical protein
MRKISYNFLFVAGLMLVLGLGTVVSANTFVSVNTKDEITRIPKNMSMVTVTTDEPMTVFVDGVQVGRTQGNQIKFEKVVTPGVHEVKITNDQGKDFTRTYTFTKNVRNCICLRTVRQRVETPCPYNMSITGPDKVQEGDLITFATFNTPSPGGTSDQPLNYAWSVSPSNARITSGLGTSSITVDTTGLGGQTVRAEVDVNDGVAAYDTTCRQRISANTEVEKYIPPPIPPSELFDKIVFRVFDDDKARLDNYAIALQNRPDVQGYIIMYQGPKVGKKFVDADKMAKRSLDYLVKVRGIDPRRIVVTNGGPREETQGDMWVVPPGAQPPVPTPR